MNTRKLKAISFILLLTPGAILLAVPEGATYTVQVPYAILREKPEKLAQFPTRDKTLIEGVILKKGDTVIELDPKDIYCKKPGQEKYCDWTYLQDWQYVQFPLPTPQTGWIHKMLIKKN